MPAAPGRAPASCDATLLARTAWTSRILSLPPPKSTGRELFNLPWLESKLGAVSRAARGRAGDAAAIHRRDGRRGGAPIRARARRSIVCGGGAHNAALLDAIARVVAPNRVASTAALGLDPDYVEAVAFAWFASARTARAD